MTRLVEGAPLHVQEGCHTAWRRKFVFMAQLEQGGWAILRRTWRRRFYAPLWFCPPAPYDGWHQYSDIQLGFWEIESAPLTHRREG